MKSMERWLYAAAIAAVLLGGVARGQCGGWLAGEPVPGVDGDVYAMVEWDPDGEGPEGAKWVVGGTFEVAGGGMARNIAAFDPVTRVWSPLSTGMSEGWLLTAVYALEVLPSGELVAGGVFGRAGGVEVNNVARWDGVQWAGVSGGTNNRVYALKVRQDGSVVAAGLFTVAGGRPANRVAVWDGLTWSGLGTGLGGLSAGDAVTSLAVTVDGSVVACGSLSYVSGQPRPPVHRWNGSEWIGLGVHADGFAQTVAVLPNGEIVTFLAQSGSSIGSNTVCRWDGGAWVPMGAPFSNRVQVLAVSPSGELFAGGDFAIGSLRRIARWNGTSWSVLESGFDASVRAVVPIADGRVLVGGLFESAGGEPAEHFAVWDGRGWAPANEGTGTVRVIVEAPNGDLIVGGDFVYPNGDSVSRIGRWDGAELRPLGGGLNGRVRALTVLANGDVIAGGEFTQAEGRPAAFVARWNGLSWTGVGGGVSQPVTSMAQLHDGRVVVAGRPLSPSGLGTTMLRVWDGVSWSGSVPEPAGTVASLVVLPTGDLAAGGRFGTATTYAGCLAIWTGSTWQYHGAELGSSSDGGSFVEAIANRPGGGLWAGGLIRFPGNSLTQSVAAWDGTAWSQVGSLRTNPVRAFEVLPNGDLVVGGEFTGSQPGAFHHLARWDGVQWSEFAGGANGNVLALALHGDQELIVGGEFGSVGGVVSSSFARYALTGIPPIADQPDSQTLTDHDTLTLIATPASGYEGVSVQWRRNGIAIVDGPGGASMGGGTVSGAARVLASPTDGTGSVLTIAGVRMSDAGTYTATFTSACSEVTTLAAAVGVDPCPADFDADGVVDGEDVILYFAAWDAGEGGADFNGDGGVDSDDVIGFFERWDGGC